MKSPFTRADMTAAQVDVRQWEELCSSFNFRIEVPSEAHERLVYFFASLSIQKTTNSLAGRLRHGDTARLLVATWELDCKRARCAPDLSEDARAMLIGTFIDPIARTGFPPGRMPRLVGYLGNGVAKFQ